MKFGAQNLKFIYNRYFSTEKGCQNYNLFTLFSTHTTSISELVNITGRLVNSESNWYCYV